MVPKFVFEAPHTKHESLTNAEYIHAVWVFRTPYSTVFTLNISAQVKTNFVRNKTVQHKIHSGEKNDVDYRITAEQFTKNLTNAVNVC